MNNDASVREAVRAYVRETAEGEDYVSVLDCRDYLGNEIAHVSDSDLAVEIDLAIDWFNEDAQCEYCAGAGEHGDGSPCCWCFGASPPVAEWEPEPRPTHVHTEEPSCPF